MITNEQRRTHYCGEINHDGLVESRVVINGWVHNYRDHGGLTFLDIRDRSGLVQLVFDPETNPEAHSIAKRCRTEDVISATGIVIFRTEENVNPNMETGKYEVKIDHMDLLNKAKTPPFQVDQQDVSEEIRLKYRFIDLRRPDMTRNMMMRHKMIQTVRRFFDKNGFMEIETPILNKSTPEGARDFLVPSRLNPGKFYALPQSPQIFKQILMTGGIDKYYQIARCFRDEDLRADRQPEFTQIDVEMSFVTRDDIMNLMETMIVQILEEQFDIELKLPIERITYQDAMDQYGIDRPDMRFDMKIVDVTDIVKDCDFSVFKNVASKGGMVKCLPIPQGSELSRKDLDDMTPFVSRYGAKGAAWMRVKNGKPESNIVKFFSESHQKALMERTGAKDGWTLVYIADTNPDVVYDSIANLRLFMGRKFGLQNNKDFKFVWVIDFPLFKRNEEEDRWDSVHHPFTAPKNDQIDKLDTNPGDVLSDAYDLVLNGTELGGGSIRIHNTDIQKKIFSLLNISEESAEEKFGFLINALSYGAPPHGGIAFGMDRIVMEFLHLNNIRDVIAFPKTQKGFDLMCDSPGEVTESQLSELSLGLEDS